MLRRTRLPTMMGELDTGELQQLKRCLRDLVALAALPATWTGKSIEDIAALSAEVLLATLRLDFVSVSLLGNNVAPSCHVRFGGRHTPADPKEMIRQFTKYTDAAVCDEPASIPDPAGHGNLRLLKLAIGHQGQFGYVASASHLDHFPDRYERLLLEVCVNQTATALKEACLVAELRESNAALRRSNEDLAQYAYAASHDLQEPLRTVSIYAQLLDKRYRGRFDVDADAIIQEVVSSARRMEHLIRDLLSHAKLNALDDEPRNAVDTAGIVRAALEDLRQSILETEASVTTGTLPVVIGSASQLRELFQNLIGNALKYRRDQESPRVHVSAVRQGPDWLFVVEDNGQGFDQRYAEKIFGVFTRLHGKEVPGTGVGLAICKKIVERHGGRIWAESSAGQGARFYFTLPGGDIQPTSLAPIAPIH
jgi:signal transduction histidine kinase